VYLYVLVAIQFKPFNYLTFRLNIARFVTGDISLRSLPDIALQALEEGLDTPSLRVLAGLADNENGYVIEKYFKDTLKELSFELPDKRQAAIEVGLAIAEEIFEGKQKVFEGFQNIKWKAIDTYPFYEETKNYCYDSIGLEKAYGLFDTIDDLRNAGSTQWQTDKTNQELENEITKELMTELKVWVERMKNGAK
jgi:hypothetical protein